MMRNMQFVIWVFTFFSVVCDQSVFGYAAHNDDQSLAPKRSHSLSFYRYHHSRKKTHVHPPNHHRQDHIAPAPSPIVSPLSLTHHKKVYTLPHPPPNPDCTSLTCTGTLTYSPAGVPCSCVWPIQVSLSIDVALNMFFPMVSELAKEISSSLSLNHSQVRIMGANAVATDLQKTLVLINLVPFKERFDPVTAFSIYRKFWTKQVLIKPSLFGEQKTVYVRYPGLPPSPPSISSSTATESQMDPVSGGHGMAVKPIGVDVPKSRKSGTGSSVTFVAVLSSVIAFATCLGIILILFLKYGCFIKEHPHVLISSHGKLKISDSTRYIPYRRRGISSQSMSFNSNILSYTGTAKIFSIDDIEKATNNFETSRIVGEGGFGIVYSGVLEDKRNVAVKVLKREDQQGGREFLAEIEMLSRLHHKNLVKLIGICADGHCHCLVYELVPNGSVESHLHGVDKESGPLDWCARMKIALGSARGLAYLHEDSNPRVIHRDFKSSNILLEHDFTPKVSDFGLARTAVEGQNNHVSAHVTGTFGYLAPEYAMTGHLLVKSDVYSYGVVLLELLTGRKPVDVSQPPGQENLVSWVTPFLSTKEGLELIVDPTFKSNISFDSLVKVAAIASMCVQSEVSHRPFMGEVVQALKLVCNDFEEIKEPEHIVLRNCDEIVGSSSMTHYPKFGYDPFFDSAEIIEEPKSSSSRKQVKSAPVKTEKRMMLWQFLNGISRDGKSEDMSLQFK